MSRRPVTARRRAGGPVALAAVVMAGALLAGCSSPAAPPRAEGASASTTGADASRTPAAELLSGTTHLLVERVHLTAAARRADADARPDALAALDAVSAALAELLGGGTVPGPGELLTTLRLVDERGVRHADAVRSGAGVAVALRDLRSAVDGLSSALGRAVPGLAAPVLSRRLRDDLAAELAVGGADPYALLDAAARRAPGTAGLLASGAADARRLPPGLSGGAAGLRAELTATLTGHVLLAAAVAREQGGARASAVRALRADGDRLAELLGDAYPPMRQQFAASWTSHVGRVTALAGSRSELDRRAVLAFAPGLGVLLAQHVRGLPATTAAVEAEALLAALADAVVAAPSPDAQSAVRRATATVPALAALLAAAIAEDRRYA